MLYPGQNAKTVAELADIPIVRPKKYTDVWQGVQHGELAQTIIDVAAEKGLRQVKDNWQVSQNLSDLYGCVDFDMSKRLKTKIELPKGTSLSLGVRHSNVGRYSVTFAVGARVAVCQNGMMIGDFVVKHRHTKGLKLRDAVSESLDQYLAESEKILKAIETFSILQMTDQRAAYLTLEMVRLHHLGVTYAPDVYENWRTPPHSDFEPRTEWSYHNAVTEVAKQLPTAKQYRILKVLPTLIEASRN